jgi:hypothetical protein
MDSDSIKERCLANMWLFFSENLAIEALYNILTQPPMSPFRGAFLDQVMPDGKEDLGEISVRLNTNHEGKAVSLEIHTEKQVIFIEPKFFGSTQECIADRTAILRKENPFVERRILCILTAMNRQGEIEEANKSEVATDNAVEVRSLHWANILGVFAKLRRNPQGQRRKMTKLLSLRRLPETSA